MPRILINELKIQLDVVKERIREMVEAFRLESKGSSGRADIKVTLRSLRDRQRVIEDRIIAYDPEAIPGVDDRKAAVPAALAAELDRGPAARAGSVDGSAQGTEQTGKPK